MAEWERGNGKEQTDTGEPGAEMTAAHRDEVQRQEEQTKRNEEAWNRFSYEAWLHRLGAPAEAAAKLAQNPRARLLGLAKHFPEVGGLRIANLMGSHGSKAVALALLGAEVTVVDLSESNARYARELAAAAGVPLRYVVADVLHTPEELHGSFDRVLMELGILHYFTDLAPLSRQIFQLLKPGGRLILQDFHPFTTKLISSKGTRHTIRKHKVTGDYFDTSLEEVEVPYAKFLPEEQQQSMPKTLLRKWTLGEIVTAIAGSGLHIHSLEEEANQDVFDKEIPKTFTIVAERLSGYPAE